ncbi:MAG: 50S ribosomal protein L11 methyltransferase [Vicinamibacteria bacterium]
MSKALAVPQEPSIIAWALDVPEAIEDEVSGLAWSTGCNGITIERSAPYTVRLVCFFDDPAAHEQAMRDLAMQFGTTAKRVDIANPDWVQRFKETFVAFDAPPFRIVPEWVEETGGHSRDLTIRMDPGRAFGTGTHESTKLCLQTLGLIAPSLPSGAPVLDLGCGTGILGIAAIKIASAKVIASDYDPLATASAKEHAAMNGVKIDVLLMDGCRGLTPGQFHLVFANLMAPFLISRVHEITAMGAPGCRFILAGLLREEETVVKAAWPADWKISATYLGEWASMLCERP